MSERNLTQSPQNSNSAAVPQFLQSNSATRIWSDKASEVLNAVVDFRSFCHKAMAEGQMAEDELVTQFERLAEAGLSGWIDSLIGEAVKVESDRLLATRSLPSRAVSKRWLASAAGLIIIGHELVGKELVKMLRGGER